MLAVILASAELPRLYTGLSLLVSAAAEGTPARGLATFGALEALMDDDLHGRAAEHGEMFARSLAELRATADALDGVSIWACAAATEVAGAGHDVLDGVMSTPRFLRETAGARLVVV
jgi:peroxiredoxin family protein